jgi:hypothetical protein
MTNPNNIPAKQILGDLDLARILLSQDSFIEGHTSSNVDEYPEFAVGAEDLAPSEPGIVSINLNGEVADHLLLTRGFKVGDDGRWYAPDGDSAHWTRSEALLLALTAEAV